MTKAQIKKRLIDIANGAQLGWNERDECFDDWSLEHFGNFIQGIEKSFNLPDLSRLRVPWSLKELDDIDSATELVIDAIKYDIKK